MAELISNGDFEIFPFTGWDNNGCTASEFYARSGECALAADIADISQDLNVSEGALINWSFWTRGVTGEGRYSIYDITNEEFIVSVTGTGVSGETYEEVTGSFTVPSGCESIRLHLYGPEGSETACAFDDASVDLTEAISVTTRALQLDILLSGLKDPDTNAVLSGGTVEFYAAGTTTAKNVWSEKAKTNAFTSVTLDANGSVANPYYGDGWYKIIVKDSAGNTEYTWDQVYLQSNVYSVVQKTEAYTATPDDDVILCSGTWTLGLQTVANFEHPLDIVNIGVGVITVDPYSTQTIGGSSTLALTAGQRVRIVPDTTSTTWRRVDFSSDMNGTELILDADGDTSLTADTDDQIDVKIGGTDQFSLKDGVIEPTTDNDIDLGATAKQFKDVYLEGSLVQNGVNKKIWKNSPSAAASSTFSGLAAGKMYTLKFRLVTSVPAAILLRFNADAGTNYIVVRQGTGDAAGSNDTTDYSETGLGYVLLMDSAAADSIGTLYFYGTSGGAVTLNGSCFAYQDSNDWFKTDIGGYYSGASALSSVVLSVGSGTLTGEIWLEEMD